VTARERRRQIDRAMIEGYRLIPPTAAEFLTAVASIRDAIAEERWGSSTCAARHPPVDC
jgi:hypothetical protein